MSPIAVARSPPRWLQATRCPPNEAHHIRTLAHTPFLGLRSEQGDRPVFHCSNHSQRLPLVFTSPLGAVRRAMAQGRNFLTAGQHQRYLDNPLGRYLTSPACEVVSIDSHWVFRSSSPGSPRSGSENCGSSQQRRVLVTQFSIGPMMHVFDVNRANVEARGVLLNQKF